jgi:hypothetical protein
MNASTGLYRLAQVIKWGGRVIGGLCLIGGIKNFNIFGLYLGLGVVIVVITAGIAWVLEGFANG